MKLSRLFEAEESQVCKEQELNTNPDVNSLEHTQKQSLNNSRLQRAASLLCMFQIV